MRLLGFQFIESSQQTAVLDLDCGDGNKNLCFSCIPGVAGAFEVLPQPTHCCLTAPGTRSNTHGVARVVTRGYTRMTVEGGQETYHLRIEHTNR
jgi:hypothetical protein